MRNEYSAFAGDFYINQRLNLKMDLSMRRDTVLSLFDRVRKDQPQMDRFKRYTDELALESRPEGGDLTGATQQWVAVRKTSVRSGSVNPETSEQGCRLHRLVLESAPYFLDISPLDIDHLEVLYGFDLMAHGNHDTIVFNALYGGSPLAAMIEGLDATHKREHRLVDCQPLIGVTLNDDGDVQAHFEIKTRSSSGSQRGFKPGSGGGSGGSGGGGGGDGREEPISVYLIVRKYGPFTDVGQLGTVFADLTARGESLLDSVVLPKLLSPIRDAIVTGG
jgi:uncharacterized membrane protein YgcG